MYCVIQKLDLRKPNRNGYHKKLEAYESYVSEGKQKYSYRYCGDCFERPIKTAYKISIHESKRVKGVVTKKQFVVTTIDHYSFADDCFYDFLPEQRIEEIASGLNTTPDLIYELIFAKTDPLQECIKTDFMKTEEQKTHQKHKRILEKYRKEKEDFAKLYGVSPDTYDYCYNIFGKAVNQSYINEIHNAYMERIKKKEKEKTSSKKSSYQNNERSNYNDTWDNLFKIKINYYTDEEKQHLKKFYRMLSVKYHPDANKDIDTTEEMALLNKLKAEWEV